MQRQRDRGNTPVICDITLLNHYEKHPIDFHVGEETSQHTCI